MKTKALCSALLLCCGIAADGLALAEGGKLSTDIFGGGGGYVHPYITTAGLYDDNVYNARDDTTSDTAVVISPGIWIAVPGTREKVLDIETTNLTPGGLRMVQDRGRKFKRMQGYLHYGGDFTRYNEAVNTDTDDNRIEGYFQFNTKGGLTVEVLDFYLDGHNEWNTGVSEELDTFKSNLLGGRVMYDGGTRFRLRADYSYYTVSYDQERNKTRDRGDNKIATYLYYGISPKTSIFAEYDYLDISYDEADYLDSKEHHMYGGIRWRGTGKTTGEFKAGYLYKDFEREELTSGGDFIFSAWVDYDYSDKTSFKLLADSIYEEPSSSTLESIFSNQVAIKGTHKLTSKFRTDLRVGYRNRDYKGLYAFAETLSEREDDEYTVDLALVYQIQDWLSARAGYRYFNRDSTIGWLSYTDNRVLVSITFEI